MTTHLMRSTDDEELHAVLLASRNEVALQSLVLGECLAEDPTNPKI